MYPTNVIERLHMGLTKIIKTRGHFPDDDAATQLSWPALRKVMRKSMRSTREWKIAMNQLAIPYGERVTGSRS
jgi:putative transposase